MRTSFLLVLRPFVRFVVRKRPVCLVHPAGLYKGPRSCIKKFKISEGHFMERPGTAATVPNRVVIGELSKLFHPLEIGTQKLFKKNLQSLRKS
jgi:hypothetical protein